ncbi:hypothetical protein C8J57DRAFT_1391746 [Mycena rebaudengoi]|nr:hypothetical protein C8J57DRAFT_1391746 [Mycena rebaudengoi]
MASYTTPPPPSPPDSARALSPAQFADMHTAHTLPQPPDGVQFPFLHGLEGDNHAQNTFFASPARRRPPPFRRLTSRPRRPRPTCSRPRPPTMSILRTSSSL